jgi:hypothetical protein
MTTAKKHPYALLGLDIGGVNSRVHLIGIADGRYQLLGSDLAPTSLGQDLHIGSGVGQAMQGLQQKADHLFLDENGSLLMPVDRIGRGLDRVGMVLTAVKKKKTALLGLAGHGSLRAARALASSLPLEITASFDYAQQIDDERAIERLVGLLPEIIIIAGGEDQGATEPLHRTIEIVRTACDLLSPAIRPLIIYAGNTAMEAAARGRLERVARLRLVPNLQPVYGQYDLVLAQAHLEREILRSFQSDFPGSESLFALTEKLYGLANCGTERMIRWLSRANAQDEETLVNRGLLAVDLGGTYTTLTASQNGISGAVLLDKFPNLTGSERKLAAQAIYDWSDVPVTLEETDQLLCNYVLAPRTIPDTQHMLSLYLAFARYRLQRAVKSFAANHGWFDYHAERGLHGHFEPIIASGAVLTQTPDPVDVLLTLLDGLQPRQITTLVLDRYHLLPLLAKFAEVEPLVPVHLLSSSAFENLACVISLTGNLSQKRTALTVHVKIETGEKFSKEIHSGGLVRLKIPPGKTAVIELLPHRRVDVGLGGQGRSGRLKVLGGLLGVVIDVRGRPLQLHNRPELRREQLIQWKRMLRFDQE